MLKNYEEMQKALQELLENNNDTTSVEKIARLSQMLDDSKAEREKFDEQHKEVVDKYMGDVVVAGMNAADEAFKKFVCSDGVCTGVYKTGLIGDVVGELSVLFDADNVAVAHVYGLAHQFHQLFGFAGALQSHDDLNQDNHAPFLVCIISLPFFLQSRNRIFENKNESAVNFQEQAKGIF